MNGQKTVILTDLFGDLCVVILTTTFDFTKQRIGIFWDISAEHGKLLKIYVYFLQLLHFSSAMFLLRMLFEGFLGTKTLSGESRSYLVLCSEHFQDYRATTSAKINEIRTHIISYS